MRLTRPDSRVVNVSTDPVSECGLVTAGGFDSNLLTSYGGQHLFLAATRQASSLTRDQPGWVVPGVDVTRSGICTILLEIAYYVDTSGPMTVVVVTAV